MYENANKIIKDALLEKAKISRKSKNSKLADRCEEIAKNF